MSYQQQLLLLLLLQFAVGGSSSSSAEEHNSSNDGNALGDDRPAEQSPQSPPSFSCYTCNVDAGQDDTEPCVDKVEQCPDPVPDPGSASVSFPSCSSVLYFSRDRSGSSASASPPSAHFRKFCTSPGSADLLTPLLSRLAERGGAGGVCQSVDSWAQIASDPVLPIIAEGQTRTRALLRRINGRRRRGGRQRRADNDAVARIGAVGPPAPPTSHSSTLLCVCTKSLCNIGDFQDVLGRSIFINGLDPIGKSLKARLAPPEESTGASGIP